MLRTKALAALLAAVAIAVLNGCALEEPVETRIEYFMADHASIPRGTEVTLAWNATNPGAHPERPSCSIARRLDGRVTEDPVEVACRAGLVEVPEAPADAAFVRYQLNVLKRSFTAGDAYLTRAITVVFDGDTPRVVAVGIDQPDATLLVGETVTITATVEVEGDASRSVVWSSSDSDIASIDALGRLQGHAPGTSTIRATSSADDTKFDTVVATVVPAPGSVLWAQQVGSALSDVPNDVALDQAGNALIVGHTSGDLGGTNLGSTDAFVLKLDPNGGTLWTRQIGTSSSDAAYAVATDGAGNVTVAGSTGGNLVGSNLGESDAFVTVVAADGRSLWTRQFGTEAADLARGVATDGAGNVIVVGSTGGDLASANAGGTDAFVRKYDAQGGELWTRQFGTDEADDATDVATDAYGNVLVVGVTSGDLAASNAGGSDVFLRLYDPTGHLIWAQQYGSAAADEANRVATTGSAIAIVGTTWHSEGFPDAFVWVVDLDGSVLWTRQIGTEGIDLGLAVAFDADGNVVVGGRTSGILGATPGGGWDGFVRTFDGYGEVLWTRQVGTFQSDYVAGVAVRPSGHIVTTGSTKGDFGGQVGYEDVFVLEISP